VSKFSVLVWKVPFQIAFVEYSNCSMKGQAYD